MPEPESVSTEEWDDLANLREFLAADVQVAAGVETERWPAGEALDRDRANRFLRQLALLNAEEKEMSDEAAIEIRRIQAWRNERQRRIDARRVFIQSALEAFARNTYELTGSKTLNLVNGTLRLRPSRESVLLVNEESFVAWAKASEASELIRTTVEPAKAAIAALPKSPRPSMTITIEEFEPDRPPGAPEPYEWHKFLQQLADCEVHRVVLDGEEVPAVVVVRPVLDHFTVTPK